MISNVRWWLWAGNPRLFYLIAGALLMGGFQLGMLSLMVKGPWGVLLIIGSIGWAALCSGVALIHWQRAREENDYFVSIDEMHNEMKKVGRQFTIEAIENANDAIERAGYGRPVVLDSVTFH